MTTQLNPTRSAIDFMGFIKTFEDSLNRCLNPRLEMMKGKKILFSSEERALVPVDGWGGNNNYCATTITNIHPIRQNTLIAAIDSSSIQVAETDDGAIYAAKCGVAIAYGGHALMHFKIGPILFYIGESTIKDSKLDHRLCKLVLMDSDSAKKLIRIRLERVIQMEISRHFTKSIILVDGSLKQSIFEDRDNTIKNIVENCMLYKNSIIGISKNTKLKILDRISNPLTKISNPAFVDIDIVIKSLVRNSMGNHILVKLGTGNSPVLRADVVSCNLPAQYLTGVPAGMSRLNGADDTIKNLDLIGRLLGNDSIANGYPESLRLAHHISTFTSAEVSCLKGHILSTYDVIELASEDIRRTLLGVIPI